MKTLCGLVAAMLVCVSVAESEQTRTPNIVFILADDLGWTDLGCQGSKYYETPNIDRMAATGLRFTSAYTCGPNCQPTRAALLSGRYGPRTGVYTVGSIDRFNWRSRPLRPVDNVTQMPLDIPTFANAMSSAGYVTGMFGKWHLGEQGRYHPSKRGFNEAIASMGKHFEFVTRPAVEYAEGTYLADFLTDKALDFVERNRDKPFLLYLPHFGVHSPFQAKADLKKKFKDKPAAGGHYDPTYAAMIASVDESVGRVFAKLEELNLAENTLVIFSSDNGGVGGYTREGLNAKGITDNVPLRSGKGSLYEGGVRVPLIAWFKGRIPAGTCDEPVISVDLFPTFLDFAGVKPSADAILDGVSLKTLMTTGGKERLGREAIYWHFPGYLGSGKGWRTTPAGAIRAGDFKLIEFFEDQKLELYNLAEDLSEKNNLATKEPERTKQLHEMMVQWRGRVKAPMPTKNTKMN